MSRGSRLRVSLVELGAGDEGSTLRAAFEFAGAEVVTAPSLADSDASDAIVVAGSGPIGPAMDRLIADRLVEPILGWIARGRPYLGIDLGLQLLFDGSDDDGADGLGVIPGRVVRLGDGPDARHAAWSAVERLREHPLLTGIGRSPTFAFDHSSVVRPGDSATHVVLAETVYGSRFPSAIDRGNVLAVQFRPERSDGDGLRLIGNFVRWATALAAGAGAERSPVGAGGTGGGD